MHVDKNSMQFDCCDVLIVKYIVLQIITLYCTPLYCKYSMCWLYCSFPTSSCSPFQHPALSSLLSVSPLTPQSSLLFHSWLPLPLHSSLLSHSSLSLSLSLFLSLSHSLSLSLLLPPPSLALPLSIISAQFAMVVINPLAASRHPRLSSILSPSQLPYPWLKSCSTVLFSLLQGVCVCVSGCVLCVCEWVCVSVCVL